MRHEIILSRGFQELESRGEARNFTMVRVRPSSMKPVKRIESKSASGNQKGQPKKGASKRKSSHVNEIKLEEIQLDVKDTKKTENPTHGRRRTIMLPQYLEDDKVFVPNSNEPSSDSELQVEISDDFEPEALKKPGKLAKKKTKLKPQAPKSKSGPTRNSKRSTRVERIKRMLKESEASGSGERVEIKPLPGRQEEFEWINRTLLGLLESRLGGCLYISGVPGTGKTATTHRTLDALTLAALRRECCDFDFVEINGMRLSEPGQAYCLLANTIFPAGQRVKTGPTALKRLEKHFNELKKQESTNKTCIVLLDELDLLLKKRQSMLYHFFEWPNWNNSQLIVITIANTMDLPERFLSNRISSRLGLTRYNFKPYDHVALANIINHQLRDYVQYLGEDAIQLCARKVAAVSGDARRAVNLAKRAVDYFRSTSSEELMRRMTGRSANSTGPGSLQAPVVTQVNLRLMDLILKEALMATPVQVISRLSRHQRLLLLSCILTRKRCEEEASIRGETRIIGNHHQNNTNTNNNNVTLTCTRVLEQHFQMCRTHQFNPLPSLQELLMVLESLEALKLLRLHRFRDLGPEAPIQLLVHEEDVRKGLYEDSALKKYII